MAREAPVMSAKSVPMPSQKICMPPPVPVEFDDRSDGAGVRGEALGDGLRVGKDGRRADDLDLVLRCGRAAEDESGRHAGNADRGRACTSHV